MTTLCGMEESPDKVYARYKGLIRSLINSIVVNNSSVVSHEDLHQAGALALIVALKSYDPSVGSFQSYIRSCIRNALLEQANSFNSVTTVDEKVRRQANAVKRLRREGLSDDEIMACLGIKARDTFLSLVELVESRSVDLDQIEICANNGLDEDQLFNMLDEINLSEQEVMLVRLMTTNHSIDEIQEVMGLSRSAVYALQASIREAILDWGRS